jgi:hypothetical protein
MNASAVFANWRKGPDRAPWKDMAVHFGISPPRISQIVGRMIEKLRAALLSLRRDTDN